LTLVYLLATLCLVNLIVPARPTPAKAAKPDPVRSLAVLVKAYNDGSAKELFPLCNKGLRESTQTRLEAILHASRNKYGMISDPPSLLRKEGGNYFYKARCQRQPAVLRFSLDGEGKFAGWGMTPTFLSDLPAGPLTLADVQRRLTEAAERSLYAYRVPSISLALVHDGRIVWAKAFGYENAAKAVPADPDTVYVTGSIFKVVIASAVMQLVDEGKLDLDAPVNRYLKGYQIPSRFEKEAPLTVRHLLSHHGGIPNGAQIISVWARQPPLPLDEVVHKRVRVGTRPGEKFEYSNFGFAFLGYLVGELSGTRCERALRQRLLDPLDMKHTVFEPTPEMLEHLAVPYVNSPDGKDVVPTYPVHLDVYPAGEIYSTPSDMARFLLLHLNRGKVNGKQLLSARSVAEMAKLQYAKKDERSGVGLGWMIAPHHDRQILWHNGAVPGYFSYMAIDPAKGNGVVLFTNKYTVLEPAFGLFTDPLVDLRQLALELLERLQPVAKPKS
jgi:CubicO group peptidase (beta-lactamase class C family)